MGMGQKPMFLLLIRKGFHIGVATVAQGSDEKMGILDFTGCRINNKRQYISHPIDKKFFATFTVLMHGDAFAHSLGPVSVPQAKLAVSEGAYPILPLLLFV